MLAEQRAERILKELAQRRAATVTDLCQVTGASEATIRRDLNALAKQGKLSKVHGGAMLMGGEFHGEELDMETKRGLFTQEKDRAARYAAGLIGDDDVVFLDAGTTVLQMAEHLRASRALFLTNSIECACRLMERNLRTHVLGGVLKAGTMALIGAETLAALRRYNFTKAFLGANGKSWNSYSRRTDRAYIGFEEAVYELETVHHNTSCKSNHQDLQRESGNAEDPASRKMFPLLL